MEAEAAEVAAGVAAATEEARWQADSAAGDASQREQNSREQPTNAPPPPSPNTAHAAEVSYVAAMTAAEDSYVAAMTAAETEDERQELEVELAEAQAAVGPRDPPLAVR